MLPWVPPIALARPPPPADVVSHGSQALTTSTAAENATSQPQDLIDRLGLSPHPEGGWFRETWRSALTIPQWELPPDYCGPRNAGTAILFLLMPGQQSAWHTVRSAELWFYHRGGPLELEVGIERDGATTQLLGSDVKAGQQP